MSMNLPIFEIEIVNDRCGIDKISLVEFPAVESNFLAFDKSEKRLLFAVENEEKRMVTGVLARCNYPIYRKDNEFGEYYIKFGEKVIKQMAEKMLKQNHQNDINIEHQENSDIEGVDMVELFIKNSEKGINPKGFEDISDGSLFATYKINNTKVWEAIKNGTFKGFSIEGLFDFEPTKDEEYEDEIFNDILEMIDAIKKGRCK